MFPKTLAAVAAFTSLLMLHPDRALAADRAQTVYVVRHLQKAAGEDPPLTEEGTTLAELVAGMFGGQSFGIKAVFATGTRRAVQTAEPLARFVGVPVTTYDPRDVPGLVAAVKAVPGNVLVVGHSNTVPELVAAFGGTRPAPIPETDYGTIYEVTAGSATVREFFVPPPPIPAVPAPERGR